MEAKLPNLASEYISSTLRLEYDYRQQEAKYHDRGCLLARSTSCTAGEGGLKLQDCIVHHLPSCNW